MANVDKVVDVLLEGFLEELPGSVFDSYHVIHDGHHGVRAQFGFSGHHLVYRNNPDSTRNFIGYITQGGDQKWYPTGIDVMVNLGRNVVKVPWEQARSLGRDNTQEAAMVLRDLQSSYDWDAEERKRRQRRQ